VGAESRQARDREIQQLAFRSRPKVAHGRVDPSAAARDLHVVEARRSQLLFLEARLAEDGVGVRVDEARREHAVGAIDARRVPISVLQVRLRPNLHDPLAVDGHGDAGHNAGVIHLTPAPGSRRPLTGDDLGGVDEQVRHAITSLTRDNLSGACASPRHP
jgi:hypothetical protein